MILNIANCDPSELRTLIKLLGCATGSTLEGNTSVHHARTANYVGYLTPLELDIDINKIHKHTAAFNDRKTEFRKSISGAIEEPASAGTNTDAGESA